tara:strand:- start:194 stop:448 length:255 start_codon:yes stop_codon:yes gene_type:complete
MGLIPANTNFYRAGKHVEKYMTMTTVTSKANTTAPSQVLASTNVQMAAAAILGMVVLMGVGFAPMDVAHNAAHDTRHSFAFPCH